jgi:hypothetical protein
MHQTYGDQTPVPQSLQESTKVTFRTEHFHLKWSHCSATADFLSGFYAGVLAAGRTDAQISDLSHSISYLVNELVENVVKFRTTGDVEIEAGVDGDDFILRIGNWIAPETSERFQKLLSEITAGDPGDLLIQRIEANAEGGGSGSGLGLLTLMNDYGARLSWQFRPETDVRIFLESSARLAIPPSATAGPA